MNKLIICLATIHSLTWLEYKFSRSYGDYFFDYSLNGRYGVNGGTSGSSKVKSTDRGVYFSYQSNIKIHNSAVLPSSFTIITWLMDTNSYFIVFYNRLNGQGMFFGRHDSKDRIRLEIGSSMYYGTDNQFVYGKMYIDKWILLTLTYTSNVFRSYINQNEFFYLSQSFSSSSSYETGLGDSEGREALKCFNWYFAIFDQVISFTYLINNAGSTNCLVGAGSCASCATAFIDDTLGTGCNFVSTDSSVNSYYDSCITEGCSKTVSFSCSQSNSFCIYDQNTHTCYSKPISESMSTTPTTVIDCTCRSPNILRSNKCCPNICLSCNHLGVCTQCYAKNAAYSSGSCTCNSGYYSQGDFANLNNCVACSSGCTTCTATTCTLCSDANASPFGSICICKTNYYGDPTNCIKCPSACQTCLSSSDCTSCFNTLSSVTLGECQCNQGYYGDGLVCDPCPSACKTCLSNNDCTSCNNAFSEVSSGKCICKEGYYGDGLVCNPCQSTCKICISDTSCTTCFTTSAEVNGGNCICKEEYYGNGKVCYPCDNTCKVCNFIYDCTKCKVSNSLLDGGACKCAKGFFGDASILCSPCHNTCADCKSLSDCVECIDLIGIIQGGQCICPLGYFLNLSFKCDKCGIGCSNCLSMTTCNKCYSDNTNIIGGDCYCNYGYFGNLNIENCIKCGFGCADCNHSGCVTCLDPNSLPLADYCVCKVGFYSLENNYECLPCSLGCRNCTSTLCHECIPSDTYINGPDCFCKPKFWPKGLMNELDACEACYPHCATCETNLTCTKCITRNSYPDQDIGCKCNEGFWNDSDLITTGSCKSCRNDCQICTSFENCLKCKPDQGELNKDKKCIKLCWKNQNSTDCVKCPDICDQCDEDLRCLSCVSNGKLTKDLCICKKGFKVENSSCTEKYFFGSIKVSSTNRIALVFNEELEKKLSSDHILLVLENETLSFDFLIKNQSCIIIIPKLAPFKGLKKSLLLTITTIPIFSNQNSTLFNYSFPDYLLPLYIEPEASVFGIDTGAGVKVAVGASIGTSMVSNPSALWSLLSTIQLIIFMPLNSVPYPDKLKKISGSLITYNIIPNVFTYIVGPNCTSTPYKEAYDYGILTSVFLINTGPLFFLFMFSAISMGVFILITRLPFANEKMMMIKSKYKYNLLIRFWIQSYLEFGVYAIIQLKSVIFI